MAVNDPVTDPTAPRWPDADDLLPVLTVGSPHPAALPVEQFTSDVDLRFQRRGGPGGQHRNKVATGVFATHLPTGIVGEATESRSQRTNRSIAIARLRLNLAIAVRTPAEIGPDGWHQNHELHRSTRVLARQRGMRVSTESDAYAAVLAILINDLHRGGGQPSLIAALWGVSTSSIQRLLRTSPAAWRWLQDCRAHHGRSALR